MSEPIDPSILQAIRKAHCEHADKGHACAGTMTVTPDGVRLECSPCGSADDPTANNTSDAAARVRAVLGVVGLDYDRLSAEAQRDAIKEMSRDYCPGCRRLRTASGFGPSSYYRCPCDGWVFSGLSWRKVPTDVRP